MATPMATPKKFAMQQVFEILLRKPSDKSIVAFLTDTKTSGLENTMEMTYPTGGRGNVYIGTGFGHSRRASLSVTLATWNTDVLAMQNGQEVKRGITEITYYDVIQADSEGHFKTKHTAVGTAGNEIGFVYALDDDGTYNKSYVQSASATATGQFAYSSSTREITFADADSDTKPKAGQYIACSYKFKTATNAQSIAIEAGKIPPTVLVSAYGLARDICNGELFPMVVEGTAQIDGNWNFDLSSDGEPVVQNLSMEFVKSCISDNLYTLTIFTDDNEE